MSSALVIPTFFKQAVPLWELHQHPPLQLFTLQFGKLLSFLSSLSYKCTLDILMIVTACGFTQQIKTSTTTARLYFKIEWVFGTNHQFSFITTSITGCSCGNSKKEAMKSYSLTYAFLFKIVTSNTTIYEKSLNLHLYTSHPIHAILPVYEKAYSLVLLSALRRYA